VKVQTAAGGVAPLSIQIQLAGIYLQRNETDLAYELYRQILQAHPDNLDAWRGLIGTLTTTNRSTEALKEIQLIPAPVRKQLETDIQFEQTEASLYAATGDNVNALAWFNRVQKHYQTLREEPPADIEIQGAYLLYNAKNDRALYPELMHLGSRQDLTATQRETIQGLWANWSVRRSATAFANGNTARAIDILDAAAQAFPDNLTVRKAVAGGYLTAGKAKEALEIFKTIDMQDATAGDFQGAIGAALTANDKGQAETWLRQALERYPHDASILGLAARFEQARGDNGRAADYWRASLAAMPKVSPTAQLAHELVNPEPEKANGRAATPRDLASLLNPDDESSTRKTIAKSLPALPSYGPDPLSPAAPVVLAQRGTQASTTTVYPVPTTTDIPLPSPQPVPVPASGVSTATHRRARHAASQTATSQNGNGAPATTRRKAASGTVDYSGRMNLPASGQTVNSTEPVYPANSAIPASPAMPMAPVTAPPAQQPQKPPVMPFPQSQNVIPNKPGAPSSSGGALPPLPDLAQARAAQLSEADTSGMYLSSQPMNPTAARAQAMLTELTDGQITQGFSLRYLPNASGSGAGSGVGSGAVSSVRSAGGIQSASSSPSMSPVQYTPSAQDAAAGAYSAQKQQTQQPVQQPEPVQQPIQQTAQPTPPPASTTATKVRRRRRKAQPSETVPTLVTAPGETPPPAVTDVPVPSGQSTTNAGLTDEELQERNLPPLKGPWARVTKEPKVLIPREEAEMQLRAIEGGYSAWLGGTGVISRRSGTAGFDSLSALSSDFEASVPLGTHARFTIIAKPVFLDSGQADGNAVTTLSTGVVPEPFGSESGTTAAALPPPQQNAVGLAAEGQLTFGNLALGGGITPYGFLVQNFSGRASWRPGGGPFTFSFNRDSVKDTQLSYSGLRDPGSASAVYPGNIWGGVMANQGNVQWARGDLVSGFYLGGGGQYITGYHVLTNKRIDGSAGAYWRVLSKPEYGSLNVGANFFGMHYTYNLQAFTYGMGGYFSPQAYFLANVPLTWTGHYLTRWHYTVLGSVGVQAFQQNAEPLAPLDLSIETLTFLGAQLPAKTSVGPNYDLRGQVAYAISDHWFVGGFAGANNSRDYTSVNAGFSIRYLFRSQPSTVAGPTGLFQTDDQHALRPLMVP
jgi:thioredoxin-like negative regulator of GroEL